MTIRRVCAVLGGIAFLVASTAPTAAFATPTPPSGCQFIPGGLSGWWSGDGSTTDRAGTNNGTLVNGATYVQGKVGQAFHFDGFNDYVQIGAPDALRMGSAVTVSAWIRPTANVSGIIVNKEGEYEITREPDGTIQWAFANPSLWFGHSVWQMNNSHGVAPLNVWTHIAVVYDSARVTTYINGVAVNVVGGTLPPGNTGTLGDQHPSMNDFRIGGRQEEPQFFAGDIDEVTVWDQPVGAADIASVASAGLAGQRVQARPTVRVDFDRLPGGAPTVLGQTIDDEYASLGATFTLADSGAPAVIANSTFVGGVRALSPTVDGSLDPAKMQDIVIDFSVPVARVSIASGDTDEAWALEAYAGSTLVTSSSPAVSGDIAVATAVASAPAATGWITRAVVDLTQASTDASGPEYFDLLQFDVADATPPEVTLSATPDANAAGWNTAPVTISLSTTDTGGSGFYDLAYGATGATSIAETHDSDGSASFVVGDEGTTTVSYAAIDCQGNVTPTTYDVRIDHTPPTVTYTGNLLSYTVDADVAITCTAADALSGVASDTCSNAIGPAWSFGTGVHTLTATATDMAGNEATNSTSFIVSVDANSLCTLTKEFVTNAGVAQSLCTRLAATTRTRTAQARAAAIGAYCDLVAAQVGTSITSDHATVLETLAKQL